MEVERARHQLDARGQAHLGASLLLDIRQERKINIPINILLEEEMGKHYLNKEVI
jgi:hypothetical protein